MSLQRIARAFVLSGILVVILAAGILSFSALRNLGIAAGWWPVLAVLLPISVDVYALISTVSWLVLAEGDEDRTRSAVNASAAVALSVAGNTIEHLRAFHVLTVGWPVVVAVSAVPPVVMALSVHLAVRFLAETAMSPELSAAVPAVVEQEAETGGDVRTGWASLPEPVKLDRTRDAVRDLASAGSPVTGAAIAVRLGITDRTGRTYLRKLELSARA